MRLNDTINEHELRKALNILKPDGQLFEIRCLKKSPRRTLSGYFTDIDTAVTELMKQDLREFNVYFTLSDLNPDCYSRKQRDHLTIPENTTSDDDVTAYNWLFIDLDPARLSDISSSDEELEKAKQVGRKVYSYLHQIGFEEPVIGMSGNGIHLLYRIHMWSTEEHNTLIKRCLEALSLLFSTDAVKVDTANFNQSRICKMYGTLSQKGAGTTERPHRMAYLISVPQEIKQTKKVYLEKLAENLPKQEKPQAYNQYKPAQFDIRGWMQLYGLRYQEVQAGDYTKFILDECPFDSSHKAPDSMITVGSSGAIGFKCFHNSCQGKTWKDVRLMFEPEAYSTDENDARIQAGWNQHKLHNRQKAINYADENADHGPVFQTARQIKDSPEETEDFILTGIEGIDNRLRGLKKGYVSLLSGLRGGSKSTLLTGFALSAVNDGNNVIAYSGELTAKNFMRWMNLQAAGKNHAIQSKKWNNYYFVSDEDQNEIADWLGQHFLLYNNDYGNNYSKLYDRLEKQIEEQKTDLVILDNLMALNIRDLDTDKYAAQTEFIISLQRLAKRTMTHIIFVAHPRKAQGFLRLDDVSGTADLTNLADNAFIVHRNNLDFKKRTKEMFQWTDADPVYSGTNIVEICKDRDMGTQDVFIPLWYEPESKRLKNAPAEMITYGWDKTDGWVDADEYDEIPF